MLSFVWKFIVDIINIVGFVCDIEAWFLGITILAVGNSVNDTITDYTMAKTGYA